MYAKTLKVEGVELAEKQRTFIKEKSALAPLDESIAVEAAKTQIKMKKEIDGWTCRLCRLCNRLSEEISSRNK